MVAPAPGSSVINSSSSSSSGDSSGGGDLLSYWHLAPASSTMRLKRLGVGAGGSLRGVMDTYTCGGEAAMMAYLSHPEVQPPRLHSLLNSARHML